ncbi:DNA polymerase [bacterium]|nr:DNA polymerase [bacterium]
MWIGDAEADGLLDEVTKMHCFVVKKRAHNYWKIVCDYDALPDEFIDGMNLKYNIEWLDHADLNEMIKSLGALAIHNLFGYDLELLVKLGYIEEYDLTPDTIDGSPVRLIDTLSMSRALYPDRYVPFGCPTKVYDPVNKKFRTVGPHGLQAWGYRVANMKPSVDDWRNLPLETYIHRCVEDVIINEMVLEALIVEAKDVAMDAPLHLGLKSGWEAAMRINNKNDYLMERQNMAGILVDQDAMWKLIDRIDRMQEELANEVEPKLPRRELPPSQRPNYPAKPFKQDSGDISGTGYAWLKRLGWEIDESKKDQVPIKYPAKPFKQKCGGMSAHGLSYLEKIGTDMDQDEEVLKQILRDEASVDRNVYLIDPKLIPAAKQVLRDRVMPDMTVPMKLSNQQDIKLYLFNVEGWQPTIWGTKDVSRDERKQNRCEEDVRVDIEEYIEAVKESPYKMYIYEEMGVNFEKGRPETVIKKVQQKARYLVTTPKFKDERGEMCPSLKMLAGDMAKAIIKWLSLRNRRSTIKPLAHEKETGWLNNPRLLVDGRIGQGHAGPTNTNRYKHRTIVNLPKADPSVLLGWEMRANFIAPEGKKILGYDGSNLEQFVAACYSWFYDNGEYADKLDGDAHATNAAAYTIAAGREVTRTAGKNITYAVLYGAQKSKISKMLGISVTAAQAVIDAFWDTNYGLKELREDLERYWTATGKKYIRGIDGRKIFTRSKHSLVNALFQSCGSIIMFLSACFMYDSLKAEGLLDQDVVRLAFVHDEFQYEVPDGLIETVAVYDIKPPSDDKDEVKEYMEELKEHIAKQEDPEGRLLSNPARIGNKFIVYYSRVGELGNESLARAGRFLKMPMPFSASYDIGNNLAETH